MYIDEEEYKFNQKVAEELDRIYAEINKRKAEAPEILDEITVEEYEALAKENGAEFLLSRPNYKKWHKSSLALDAKKRHWIRANNDFEQEWFEKQLSKVRKLDSKLSELSEISEGSGNIIADIQSAQDSDWSKLDKEIEEVSEEYAFECAVLQMSPAYKAHNGGKSWHI